MSRELTRDQKYSKNISQNTKEVDLRMYHSKLTSKVGMNTQKSQQCKSSYDDEKTKTTPSGLT